MAEYLFALLFVASMAAMCLAAVTDNLAVLLIAFYMTLVFRERLDASETA